MNLLCLTIFLPFFGFLFLNFFCKKSSKNFISIIGIGSIFLSTVVSILVTLDFINNLNNNSKFFIQKLFTWININNFNISVDLKLDGLSVTMLLITNIVGLLVHIYSINYIDDIKEYKRFFSYMNLFISSMLLLILSNNIFVMYVGWEIIGVCSYLLIGFYYKKYKNILSSIKSFIFSKIGDLCLIISMIIIYNKFNTLNFDIISLNNNKEYFNNSLIIFISIFMFFIGIIGKSAQIPLNTWLSDAMSAPTPSSALLHSSTMVTSGIYLIARMHKLFLWTPNILYIMSFIGSITMIMSSIFAINQKNIKKILAYSTMSQLGYIFISLSIKEWYLAIFYLINHAFIKSFLFLFSDILTKFYNKEQNIYKISKIKNFNIFLYILFLFGIMSISSFPFLTSNFYCKDLILSQILEKNHIFLFIISLIGSFFTSLYVFRMIFIIFSKKEKIKSFPKKKYVYQIFSLLTLIILSNIIGPWIKLPINKLFYRNFSNNYNLFFIKLLSSIIILSGILISYFFWGKPKKKLIIFKKNKLYNFLFFYIFNLKNIDYFYNKIFVSYFLIISKNLKNDPINNLMSMPILKINKIFKKIKYKKFKLNLYIELILFGLFIILFLLYI